MTLFDYFKDNIPPSLPDSITPNHHAAVLQMVLALKYLAEKKIVHGDMHWNNVLYPYYSDLQHNGWPNTDVDSQLEIPINGTQTIKTSRVIKIFDWDLSWDSDGLTIKTSRVIKIFDWDLSWDSDGLGAMRKDLIGARNFSKLDEIYDKVGFLRSLLKYGYFRLGERSS
jgi:hypothetical protein